MITFICEVCSKQEAVTPADAKARIEDNQTTTCEGCRSDERKARALADAAAKVEYDTVFAGEHAGLRAARLGHG